MLSPWVRLAAALFAVSWGANQFAPMQLVYREHLGLGNGSFTAMLASYVVGLVPALLYFGRVSDRFGRRAVILPMIPVGIVSSLVLIAGAAVPDLLYLGRVLAGLASGMAFGAGTAWMKELSSTAPSGAGARRAAVSLSAGFGCGALFAGVIAQWLPAPELLPYLVHIALMLVPWRWCGRFPTCGSGRPTSPRNPCRCWRRLSSGGASHPGRHGCSVWRPCRSQPFHRSSPSHCAPRRWRSPDSWRR